jgi:hypothetical protein
MSIRATPTGTAAAAEPSNSANRSEDRENAIRGKDVADERTVTASASRRGTDCADPKPSRLCWRERSPWPTVA